MSSSSVHPTLVRSGEGTSGVGFEEDTPCKAGPYSHKLSVRLRDVATVLEYADKASNEAPAGMSINCEGCEYDILERFLNTIWFGKVSALQVSWHNTDDAHRVFRRCKIESQLADAGYERKWWGKWGWVGYALGTP